MCFAGSADQYSLSKLVLSLGLSRVFQAFVRLAGSADDGRQQSGVQFSLCATPSHQRHYTVSKASCVLQAQQMIADNIGLAMAVSLSYACRNDPRGRQLLPLLAFPLLATGDLCSIYRELKSIHLRNLNKERAEIVAEMWLDHGRIPSAAEVLAAVCVWLCCEHVVLEVWLHQGNVPFAAEAHHAVCVWMCQR